MSAAHCYCREKRPLIAQFSCTSEDFVHIVASSCLVDSHRVLHVLPGVGADAGEDRLGHVGAKRESMEQINKKAQCFREPAGAEQTNGARRGRRRATVPGLALAASLCLIVAPVHADVLDSLLLRVDSLQAENRQLRQDFEALRTEWAERAEDDPVDYPSAEASPAELLRVDSEFGYDTGKSSSSTCSRSSRRRRRRTS